MLNYLNKKLHIGIYLALLLSVLSVPFFTGCSTNEDNTKVVQKEKPVYTCPMHPQVISDKPGVCPICHMDLVLKTNGSDQAMEEKNIGAVNLSGQKQLLANVAVVNVKRENIFKTISAYSYLDFAEQNRKLITARFNGRIEKLYVDKTGDYIHKGQPLFEIYSPDLVQAQNEYLIALNGLSSGMAMGGAVQNNNNSLINSAKQKLLLYGLTADQISDLEKNKSVKLTLTYYSPFSGSVIDKKIEEGIYVNEGAVIYDIADLSTLWNISEVYENDLSAIKEGSKIQLTLNSYPGETFEGRVNLIYPVVNSETRTIKIRSSVLNKGNKLKPNMYGQTSFSVNYGMGLTIPEESVLFTGKRNIVYVKSGDNLFEPREITLGLKFDGKYQVLSGLDENDQVASSGAYLIDSESQLKTGFTAAGHEGHNMPDVQQKGNNQSNHNMSM